MNHWQKLDLTIDLEPVLRELAEKNPFEIGETNDADNANPSARVAWLFPEHAAELPHLWDLVMAVPGKPMRARITEIVPGGYFGTHTDARLPGTARFHIPIFTNPEAVFFFGEDGKEELHMEAGSVYFLDQTLPHGVLNNGTAGRIHLIIDADV